MFYLVNLFLKISYLSPADGRSFLPKHFFFTYSMTMDKVLVNLSGFSFVKPVVKNVTCYKVVSACHENTDSFNTHYKI